MKSTPNCDDNSSRKMGIMDIKVWTSLKLNAECHLKKVQLAPMARDPNSVDCVFYFQVAEYFLRYSLPYIVLTRSKILLTIIWYSQKKQFWRYHLYCLGAVVNFLFADFLHRSSHIWMIYSTISNPEMMDIPSHRLIWLPILDNKSDVCKNICNNISNMFRTKSYCH